MRMMYKQQLLFLGLSRLSIWNKPLRNKPMPYRLGSMVTNVEAQLPLRSGISGTCHKRRIALGPLVVQVLTAAGANIIQGQKLGAYSLKSHLELKKRHVHASASRTESQSFGVNGSSYPKKPQLFNYPHTVGVIGSANSRATVEFVSKIVEAAPEDDLIPLLVCSDPAMRSNSSTDASHLAALIEKRRFLEEAGVRCIVMPCHSSHLWYEKLVSDSSVPFLNIADCLVGELKAAELRPLEGANRPKIGVLATEATLAAGFYQKKLKEEGFDVVLPDKASTERIVLPGIEALQRRDLQGAKNLIRIAVQMLLVNAVNMVVLGGHDMKTAFSPEDPLLQRCIDPTDALARATVKWAHAARLGQEEHVKA